MTTTAQWIAAWGTVGGAVATVVTVLLAFLGLRGELRRANEQRALDAAGREQDRRDRLERETAQARLLLVSIEVTPPPPDQWIMELATHPDGEVRVWVHNHSSAPILFAQPVVVLLRMPTGPGPQGVAQVVEPGNLWAPDPGQEVEHGPIPAGGSRRWDVIVSRHVPGGGMIRHVVAESDQYLVTVAYTDAAGLRWLRTGDQQPVPDRRPSS